MDRPARAPRPLRYWPWARAADAWHAGRDARASLPDLEHACSDPVTTSTVAVLARTFEDRAHRVEQRLLGELAPLRARLAELAAVRSASDEQYVPVPVAVAPRGVDDDLVLAWERRATDPAAGDRARTARTARLRARQHACAVETARLEQALHDRTACAAAQVHRIHAHTLRRIDAYERRLVRRHAAGPALLSRLRPARPQLPGWAALAITRPVTT